MNRKLKVCVLGCGGISGAHVPAWEKMEDVYLAGVCDIRPEKAERYKGHPVYYDFETMVKNEQPDILDICLPTFLHCEYAVKAMDQKINVICEKPVSLKEEEVHLLYQTAEKNGVKYMVAQVLRFWSEYEVLKRVYDTKKYGELISGTMWRLGGYPGGGWNNWYYDKKLSGLIPFDLHIHDADFLIYAFGEPSSVTVNRKERPEQDYLSAVYRYNTFFVTAEASWYKADYPFYMGYRFQFENAVLAFERDGLTVYEPGNRRYQPINEQSENKSDFDLPSSNAYFNELRYFADCVKNDLPIQRVTEDSLLAVLKILNAM